MKTLLKFLENNSGIKIIISMILIVMFAMLFVLTEKNIFLWLEIIPGLYLVPLVLVSFVYAWIIRPISLLIKRIKRN